MTITLILHQLSSLCPEEEIDTWMICAASMLSRASASIQLAPRHIMCCMPWAALSARETSASRMGRATARRPGVERGRGSQSADAQRADDRPATANCDQHERTVLTVLIRRSQYTNATERFSLPHSEEDPRFGLSCLLAQISDANHVSSGCSASR